MQNDYKPVTCIGARKLPSRERPRLMQVARELESQDYTVRSGGAIGSDSAFEAGLMHPERAEIYLPPPHGSVCERALQIAEKHHPAWHRCNEHARLLHGRNSYQVLGKNLDSPSLFVVCWTPGAMDVGGTSQALRIARRLGLIVYNLADEHQARQLDALLRSNFRP